MVAIKYTLNGYRVWINGITPPFKMKKPRCSGAFIEKSQSRVISVVQLHVLFELQVTVNQYYKFQCR